MSGNSVVNPIVGANPVDITKNSIEPLQTGSTDSLNPFSSDSPYGLQNAGNSVASAWQFLTNPFRPPDQPTLKEAGAAPTPQDASKVAINNTLQSEQARYRASNASTYLFGSGQGLLDDVTTTTSGQSGLMGY